MNSSGGNLGRYFRDISHAEDPFSASPTPPHPVFTPPLATPLIIATRGARRGSGRASRGRRWRRPVWAASYGHVRLSAVAAQTSEEDAS